MNVLKIALLSLTTSMFLLVNVSCTKNFESIPFITGSSPKKDPSDFKWTAESNTQGQLIAKWSPAAFYPDLLGLKIVFYKGNSCQLEVSPAASVSATTSEFTASFIPEDSEFYTYKLIKIEAQTEIDLPCSEAIQYKSPFTFASQSGGKVNAANIAVAPFSGECLEGHQILLKESNHAPTFVINCNSDNWNTTVDLSFLPGTYSGTMTAEFRNNKNELLYRSDLTINVDTILPTLTFTTLPTITSSNQTNYLISGSCSEVNQAVTVTAGAIIKTVNCDAGSFSETFDFSSTASGVVTIAASHTDSFDNSTSIQELVPKNSEPPIITSFKINSDASATNSLSVNLNIDVDKATEMFVASDASCALGTWETYATTKPYTLLLPNSNNTVYAKFRDGDGNQTACVSDDILHDNIGPLLTVDSPLENFYVNSSNQSAITLSGTCNEENASIIINGPSGFTGSALCTGTTFSQILDLSGLADGTIQFNLEIKDTLNNPTNINSPNYIKDTLAPSFSFSLNSGALNTKNPDVTLNITHSQAAEVYISNDSSCSSGGVWSEVSSTKPWTLALLNAENTVYAKARDAANNESTCVSDKIVHYTNDPTLTLITPGLGTFVNSLNQTAVTFSGGCSEEGQVVNLSINGSLLGSPLCSSSQWTTSLDLSSLNDGSIAVHLEHKSSLDVEAPSVDRTIIKDTLSPTISDFKINNGDLFTNSLTVNLTVDSIDATEIYITNNALCLSGGSWAAYVSSISGWTLQDTNSINTVYLMVRDEAGNTSNCESRLITHDNVIPTVTIETPLANSYINIQNNQNFVVSGTCSEEGRNVHLQIETLEQDALCSAGAWTGTLDLSSLADQSTPGYSLIVSLDRPSGNSGTANRSFLKNTQRPTLSLANIPNSLNTLSAFDIEVTGDATVSHYRYLLLNPGDSTDCADLGNYVGPDISVNTHITGALSSQGLYKLCILGRNAANNWMATPEIISWTRDTLGPKVLTVDSLQVSGSYESGTTLNIRVNFDENVTVTGVPRIFLETGDTDRYATYSSGSGTSSLIFSYQIQNGDFANILDYKATTSLELNSGTLVDSLSNSANVTLPTPGQPGSLSITRNIVVDAYNFPNSVAVLSGFPLGTAYSLSLNISISGLDVVAYKYKIGKYGIEDCSSASGYSPEIISGTPITETLNGFNYGDILVVCALGKNSSGFWQKRFAASTEYFQYNSFAANYKICDSVKTTSEPKGRLFDSGGPLGMYSNSESVSNCHFTINSATAPQVINYKVDTESGYDYLKIFDASNTTTPISTLSGNHNSTLSVPSGNTYLTFNSDASVFKTGFEVTWGNTTPLKYAAYDLTHRWNQAANASLNIPIVLTSVTVPVVVAVDSADTTLSATSGGPRVKSMIVSTNSTIYIQTKTPSANNTYRTIPVAFGELIFNWYVATPISAITVTDVTSEAANATYGPGDVIDIKVKLSDAVNINGSLPSLSLNSGGVATYYAGSGTDELLFRYTVAEGHTSDDLGYSNTTFTNSTSIKSVITGANIDGTLPLSTSSNSLIQNKDIVIHAVVPVMASLTNPPAPVNFESNFSFNVSSNNVTNYRYKFGKSTDVNCLNDVGYSPSIDVATPISIDQSSAAEDLYKICLIGQATNGKWQQVWSPTEYSWRKDSPVIQTYSMCSSTAATNSKGVLFDSGGLNGDFSNNENCLFEINNSSPISIKIQAFNTEFGVDKLTIYDGNSSGAVLLSAHSGSTVPASTFTTSGNTATLRFVSDNSLVYSGYVIGWNAQYQLDLYAPALANFLPIYNAALSAVVTSNQLTINNLSVDTIANVSEESAYIRNVTKNTRWNKSVVVSPNDKIEVKALAPDSLATGKNIIVKVGNRTAQWNIYSTYPAPTAVIYNTPSGVVTGNSITYSVGGTDVVGFRFAIASDGNCGTASYSAILTTLAYNNHTFSIPANDRLLTLCVRGVGAYENAQTTANATAFVFTYEGASELSISPHSLQQVTEGSSHALTFSITRKKVYDLNINYEIRGTAQGSQFHNLSDGMVTIPAGQTSATLNLNIATNPNVTGTKNLIVNIVSTNANVASFSAANHAEFHILDSENMSIKTQKMAVGRLSQCAILSNGKLKCWGNNNKSQVISTGHFHSFPQEITIAGEVGFQDVSTSFEHTCAIGNSSKIYCWGDNTFGQVGANKSGEIQTTPIESDPSMDTYTMVTTGHDFTCAINTANSVKCWGRNPQGQLGVGDLIDRTVPTEVAGFKASYISAGIYTVCAISHPDNQLYCWGNNSGTLVGDGTTINRSLPTLIDSGVNYSKVSIGNSHACAVTTAGTVKCWGKNTLGQLGRGGYAASSIPVPVSSGIPGAAQIASIEVSKISKTIDDGYAATCALTSSSSTPANALYCWGSSGGFNPSVGAAGLTVPTLVASSPTLKSISMGGNRICGIDTNDAPLCWGSAHRLTQTDSISSISVSPTNLGYLSQFSKISNKSIQKLIPNHASLNNFTQSALESTSLLSWGLSSISFGDYTNPQVNRAVYNFMNVSYGHSIKYTPEKRDGDICVINSDDKIICSGKNDSGEFGAITGDVTSFKVIDPSDTYLKVSAFNNVLCGINTNNKVKCAGRNSSNNLGRGSLPVTPLSTMSQIDDNSNYIDISVGTDFVCGVTSTYQVKCWGSNSSYALGRGTATSSPYPTSINSALEFSRVFTASSSACAITKDTHKLYCWGRNSNYYLGNGTNIDLQNPTEIDPTEEYQQISFGNLHTCGTTVGNALKCWGLKESFGELSPSDTIKNLSDTHYAKTPLAVSTPESIKSVAAMRYGTCIITSTNKMYCIGKNANSQFPIPTYNTGVNFPVESQDVGMPMSIQRQPIQNLLGY